ncbi:MAG: hypothetical protein M3294_01130 [Pseudomonadota bacterium]|nr:hypothetical protein [Pseudomonadota bacterium]
MAGVLLHWEFTLLAVFAVSAIMRLLVACIFLPRLRKVRQVRPLSINSLIFRVTRIHAVSGLKFEIVGPKDRDC